MIDLTCPVRTSPDCRDGERPIGNGSELSSQFLQCRDLVFRHPARRFFTNASCTLDDSIPHRLRLLQRADHFPPTVLCAALPQNQAVPLHPIEDSDKGRGLDVHSLRQFDLRKTFLKRQPAENLTLPVRDSFRRQLLVHRPLEMPGGDADPVANAALEIVLEHTPAPANNDYHNN
jgi:hypothetical protein